MPVLVVKPAIRKSIRAWLCAGVAVASAALLAVGVMPASASSGTGSPLPTVNEWEPNGSIATANTVYAPANVSGSVSSTLDTDYFKVTLPANMSLSATLTAANSSSDFDLYLVNTAATKLATSENGAGLAEIVTYVNGRSSSVTLYVRVVRYSGTGGYTLKLQW